jgi:hypothetical protein
MGMSPARSCSAPGFRAGNQSPLRKGFADPPVPRRLPGRPHGAERSGELYGSRARLRRRGAPPRPRRRASPSPPQARPHKPRSSDPYRATDHRCPYDPLPNRDRSARRNRRQGHSSHHPPPHPRRPRRSAPPTCPGPGLPRGRGPLPNDAARGRGSPRLPAQCGRRRQAARGDARRDEGLPERIESRFLSLHALTTSRCPSPTGLPAAAGSTAAGPSIG